MEEELIVKRTDRVLASIIDTVILIIPLMLILFPLIMLIGPDNFIMDDKQTFLKTFVEECASVVILFAYFIVFPLLNNGQTIGRKVMNIKVVRENGEEAKFIHFTTREFFVIYLLHLITFGVFSLVSIISSLFREDKKCLHDIMSKTKFVYTY